MKMKTKLKRRLFLRGLGGRRIIKKFLGSIQERPAHAQESGTPKRLIVMFTHYGCLTNLWFPQTSHGPLSAAELQERTLSPLAPYASKLLMPRGIRAMNEWNFSHERGQGNDPHTNPTGSFFTCQPITPHNQVHEFNDAKSNAMPIDRSLDHVIAEQISPGGAPLLMRMGGFENEMTAISYSGPEERYSGISSAAQVYSNITGLFQNDQPMSPDTYAVLRGKSVIDVVRDDLSTMERFDMSGSDRQKLEAWKELLDQNGGVVASAQCNEETAAALGLPGQSGADIMADVGGGRDVADLFSSLATLAAICDANRVIFLKYPGNYTFTGLGHTGDSHGLSHRIGTADQQGTCVDGVMGMLEDIDRYYAEKFAYLVGQLDSFDEGDGTVLDNSATVWFNELSDGNAHNMNNMPILQAGGCGGYFKTGQAVNLDGGTNDLTAGNSLGQCNNPGEEANGISQSTGTPAEIGSRPINKYFCNLMNGVGVKAGPDGFPLAGGTGEVTHFGRWDRTEDFRNGPDGEPPLISDPGEYSELRG
jgi:hypothetical protein